MGVILDFLVNNYIWFLVITFILLFALIGYLVDIKKDERFTKKIEIEKEIEARLDVANAANITLNQMVQKQSEETIAQIERNKPFVVPNQTEKLKESQEVVNTSENS